ncbi:anthranilate synthase component I family protein [Microbacterium sp. SORGH_AS_0888]|uniref:anthranilate synthase component I family protein n=1 Tax=Microbacterium sp. SORGH_AS_0888 TaxID=3041791 RepID=UPI00278294A0|nr:anthranilate synthase component I family protein [Microbacterium sp. SORGH_AS_0888]MDQ1128662.1 para-aminobenzoate synthetase component 1 [Microbacterium sp. SORGH_AS_0888]
MHPSYTVVELPPGCTPERAFAAVRDEPHAFWLDAGPGAVRGWSILGTGRPADPAEVAATPLSEGPAPRHEAGPLRSGWVGWIGYEAGAAAAGAPLDPAPDPMPAQCWIRAERIVSFDHATGRAWVSAPDADALATRIAAASPVPAPVPVPNPVASVARVSPAEYAARIERCRAAIGRGDAYQLCLTTRFEVDGEFEPDTVHAALRSSSPSHHGAYIRSAGHALIGASPEVFLEVRDGIVRTAPIKGTRPRGESPEEDVALAHELHASPKERAENVMIVDLMRNDLATVCETGTVSVERLLEVESYPAVHQLVSAVAGRIRGGTTVADLLRAAFPAGSMTGAPKLSAMTLLRQIEAAPRGAFAGCLGWIGDDGCLDLAMTIRTVLVHPDGAYVGAGGGITWHSHAAEEVAEVGLKARAPLAALGATVPPGW